MNEADTTTKTEVVSNEENEKAKEARKNSILALEDGLKTNLSLIANDLEGFGAMVRSSRIAGDNKEISDIREALGTATLEVEKWLYEKRAGEFRQIFEDLLQGFPEAEERAETYLSELKETFDKLVEQFTRAAEGLKNNPAAQSDRQYSYTANEFLKRVRSLETEVFTRFAKNFPDYQERIEQLKETKTA